MERRSASRRPAFQHRRVGGAVVHRAVMPGIDVAGEQDEAVFALAVELADQVGNGRPSRAHARRHADAQRPAGQEPAQALAVGAEDRQARRGRDPPRRLRRRRSPDRRHDHVVEVVHEDVDLAEDAGLLRGPRPAGGGEAANQCDLARRAPEIFGPRVTDVDDLCLQPFRRRRERVGQPLDDGAVVETDPSIEGQAYVRLDLPALHLDAVRLECALDVVECLGLARAAGLALPRADRAHVLHERLRRHLGSQRRLERIAVFPGRGR